MITIKGDLILEKDTEYNESLTVEGNIFGKDGERFNLKVNGNLNCWDLNGRDLNCENLNCWDLNGRDLNCENLDCWDLNCCDLNCRDLNCENLDCLNLNCENLICRDLDCLDLDCWDLNCCDLNCRDLNCENLICRDLNCENLDCWDLNFYAVAISYKTFKCKSWKARRENYIIKCLDGKIEIKNEIREEIKLIEGTI